jgi:Holliday junction resolvase RusA-like endonuclease
MNKLMINGIDPMGCVRMTRRGKFTSKYAQRYLVYKKLISLSVRNQYKGKKLDGPINVVVKFIMPIPESWSGKKKREAIGKPHTKKPDIDNLLKGLFDSVNKIVWIDDNQVYQTTVRKIYGETPGIEMEIIENEGE